MMMIIITIIIIYHYYHDDDFDDDDVGYRLLCCISPFATLKLQGSNDSPKSGVLSPRFSLVTK